MPRLDVEPVLRYPGATEVFAAEFAHSDDLRSMRRTCRRALDERGVTAGHADAVVLVLSELATNALCHAQPPYSAAIKRNTHGITVVEVADHGDGLAAPRTPELERGGYGLNLVNELSDVWGVHHEPNTRGNVVWAVLSDARRV
jgi:anti-sigma regulatory factor (Ser/Thr protein kinase)